MNETVTPAQVETIKAAAKDAHRRLNTVMTKFPCGGDLARIPADQYDAVLAFLKPVDAKPRASKRARSTFMCLRETQTLDGSASEAQRFEVLAVCPSLAEARAAVKEPGTYALVCVRDSFAAQAQTTLVFEKAKA